MKIVSKTKDYYDHVANILGVDESLRYSRTAYNVEKLMDGSNHYPDFATFTLPRHVIDDYEAVRQKYPLMKKVIRNDYRDQRYGEALFVGGRAFVCWRDIVGADEWRNNVYGPLISRSEVECPDWLHGISLIVCQPVFVVHHMDIRLSVTSGENRAILYNRPPILADMGLPRLLDAMSAYSAIQTWMENMRVVSDALNGTPPVADKYKIQAAGFDLKTSFRKR